MVYQQGQVKSVVQKAVARYLDPEGAYIFLFGSRAAGTARRASDYDIGLYTGEQIPFAILARIEDEMEEYPIPVKIDFVDFSMTTPEFRKIALQKIELWNSPKKNLGLI